MKSSLALGFGVALGLAALATCGCGRAGGARPELGKVRGTVSYNGKPVPSGTVTFFPIEGKGGESGLPAIGELDTDGSFELTTFDTGDGAIIGQHKTIVVARPENASGDSGGDVSDGMIPSQLPEDLKKAENAKSLVPLRYSDPEKTPLKYTVKAGENQFEITLKD